MAPFPKKEIIDILKNLNKKHTLNKRFRKNELSAAEYCDQSNVILQTRAFNIAALVFTGTACAIPYLLDADSTIRESALFMATTAIATAAAFNFAFENFKDLYFDNIRNKQYFKTRIIDETISNINKNDVQLMGSTFNSNELYNALMWGNELHGTKTGFIIEKTQKIISKIQEKWSTSKLNIWKENRSDIENLVLDDLLKKKESIKNIVEELYNPESRENKLIKASQRTMNGSDANDDSETKKEIKRINKIAIKKATELYNNQALELIFLKVAADFSNGIKHHKLLHMLKDLATTHVYKNKEDNKMVSSTNFNKISNYVTEMLGGINILENRNTFKPNLTITDIALKINPNLVSSNNKIKFVSYENLLINQKDAVINNFTNIKKSKVNEIAISKLDLDKIISIKENQEQSEIDKKEKMDKKLRVYDIILENKTNRNIRT